MKKLFRITFLVLLSCFCLVRIDADAATKKSTGVSSKSSNMEVHFIDVGQADSILIQSAGKNMLIDAGNRDDGKMLVQYLQKQGVSKLDYLIGTHPHEDHIGGMTEVIESFEIDTIIIPQKEHTTKTFENFIDAVAEKELSLTKPVIGKEYRLGKAEFTIIAPNKKYGDELNNWSVGIKLINGETSFVMCGDAEKEAEEDICKNKIDIQADVLKIGHHGSKTASSKAMLDAVDPTYAIIFCGKDNSYGHPHQETMEVLKTRNIKVFRTDLQGTIVAKSDGKKITFSQKPCEDYSAGEAESSTEEKTVEKTVETTVVTPSLEQQESVPALPAPAGGYIGNRNNQKLHKSTCRTLPKEKNRVYFNTRDEAVASGYADPCKNCNP